MGATSCSALNKFVSFFQLRKKKKISRCRCGGRLLDCSFVTAHVATPNLHTVPALFPVLWLHSDRFRELGFISACTLTTQLSFCYVSVM